MIDSPQVKTYISKLYAPHISLPSSTIDVGHFFILPGSLKIFLFDVKKVKEILSAKVMTCYLIMEQEGNIKKLVSTDKIRMTTRR